MSFPAVDFRNNTALGYAAGKAGSIRRRIPEFICTQVKVITVVLPAFMDATCVSPYWGESNRGAVKSHDLALSETIAKRVKELDNREWNFEMKKFDAHVSLESQRISAMAEVGKAMAKRPVNYYNMNRFGWW